MALLPVAFSSGLQLRRTVAKVLNANALATLLTWPLPSDAELSRLCRDHIQLLELFDQTPPSSAVGQASAKALLEPDMQGAIIAALAAAPQLVAVINELLQSAKAMELFSPAFIGRLHQLSRRGNRLQPLIQSLAGPIDTLEGVLRVAGGLKNLPASLTEPASIILSKGLKAADGYSTIQRNVLAGEISKRFRENPDLQNVDGHRLANSFNRFRELTEIKKEIVRDDIAGLWIARQKARLLASTGTRLNRIGANLQRRLTLRGQKATRLRQIIAQGREVEGGDPLFELRPVWMASPETVAQLFAREPIFDVIVFDEASQCRLEEALPVLTRGKRIVIAGDPRQLPPTRFFESTVATSEESEAETNQEYFEQHQGEVEDLLTAALSLEGVEQCYLNVHYRSRNSDLIGFSNEHFYGSRLQAILGHPNKPIVMRPSRCIAPTVPTTSGKISRKPRRFARSSMTCCTATTLRASASPVSTWCSVI